MPTTRKLAIALAISIGLNLFLGGAIASAWLVKRHYAGLRPPLQAGMAGDFNFRGGLAALGNEARPLAREIRREHGPRLREAGKEIREARQDIARLLRADTIDPAELSKALAVLRQRSDEAQAVMHEVLVKAMTSLTPDQRRKFLEAAIRRGPSLEGGPPRPENQPPR